MNMMIKRKFSVFLFVAVLLSLCLFQSLQAEAAVSTPEGSGGETGHESAATAPWSFLRYGLLINQQDLKVTGVSYGNMAGFSKEPLQMTWNQPETGVAAQVYLGETSLENTQVVEQFMGVTDLAYYEDLYTVTHYIYLNEAWLSGGLLLKDIAPELKGFDRSKLFGTKQIVHGNYVGKGPYIVKEDAVSELLEYASIQMLWNFLNTSASSVSELPVSLSDVDASIYLKLPFGMKTDRNGDNFSADFLASSAELSVVPLFDDKGDALLAADGEQLYAVSGIIPIQSAVRLPSKSVKAKVISLELGKEEIEEEEFTFNAAELFEYIPALCEGLVIGWNDETVETDLEAIQAAVAAMPHLETAEQIEELRRAIGADVAYSLNRGDLIYGAASLTESGYTGVTIVTLYTEANMLDLALVSLSADDPPAGYVATATIGVENSSEFGVYSRIRFTADNPSMSIVYDVYLTPGMNYSMMTFSTPANGGTVQITAEVSPEKQPKEKDYSNNLLSKTVTFTMPTLPNNESGGRSASHTWQEQRKHTYMKKEVVGTNVSASGTSPIYDWRKYTCTHNYFYKASISVEMLIDYRGVLHDGAPTMKSGYGFSPQLTVTGNEPVLLAENVAISSWATEDGGVLHEDGSLAQHVDAPALASGCGNPNTAPSANSSAVIVWPEEALFSWRPNTALGHNYESYVVRNTENRRSQPAAGIAMAHKGTTGNVSVIEAAANLISASSQKRIYTNEALRNGYHSFVCEIDGGSITYGGWKGLLGIDVDGRVHISGTMYEDDFTGAVIP